MASEKQLIEGTIRSLNATIRFQDTRPDGAGDYAMSRAIALREKMEEKLAAITARKEA